MANNKEGGNEIKVQGHHQGMDLVISVLGGSNLPEGLFQLDDVAEVLVRNEKSTIHMRIMQKKKVIHEFEMISQPVSYETEISCSIEDKTIKSLKGVKAKKNDLWHPVSEITIDDKRPGNIQFKGSIVEQFNETFDVKAFATGQSSTDRNI